MEKVYKLGGVEAVMLNCGGVGGFRSGEVEAGSREIEILMGYVRSLEEEGEEK